MYSETLTAKEQDANYFLSVAGTIFYAFPNVAPGVIGIVIGYLGEVGASRWLDHHTKNGELRLVVLSTEQCEELEDICKWSAKKFFDTYKSTFTFTTPTSDGEFSETGMMNVSAWVVKLKEQ